MSKKIVPKMGEITEKAHDEQSHKSNQISTRELQGPVKCRYSEKAFDEIRNLNKILHKKIKNKSPSKRNQFYVENSNDSTGYIKVFDKSSKLKNNKNYKFKDLRNSFNVIVNSA